MEVYHQTNSGSPGVGSSDELLHCVEARPRVISQSTPRTLFLTYGFSMAPNFCDLGVFHVNINKMYRRTSLSR